MIGTWLAVAFMVVGATVLALAPFGFWTCSVSLGAFVGGAWVVLTRWWRWGWGG